MVGLLYRGGKFIYRKIKTRFPMVGLLYRGSKFPGSRSNGYLEPRICSANISQVFFEKGAWLKFLQGACNDPADVTSLVRRTIAAMAKGEIPAAC